MSTVSPADTSPFQTSESETQEHLTMDLDYDELTFEDRDAIDAQDLADALSLLNAEDPR